MDLVPPDIELVMFSLKEKEETFHLKVVRD
jgi:hypothetical protein